MKNYGLVADIGGTKIRFAMVDLRDRAPKIFSPRNLSTKDHPDIAAAARAYLSEMHVEVPPRAVVFAVAGPVNEGAIYLTNAGWKISAKDLRDKLFAETARVVNDYEALSAAAALLGPDDLVTVGPAKVFDAHGDGTITIIGPGTGLGVAGFVRQEGVSLSLVTEGGHAAFAPGDDVEIEILQILMRKFGRVSAERILSGPGLLNLYSALAQIDGVPASDTTPEEITRAANTRPESFEAKVFDRFCAILGAVAGDMALAMGARRGVLIAGGILPDVAQIFAASSFRRRFEDKGRFAGYMKSIPTLLIVQREAGLIGSAAILTQHLPALAPEIANAAG